LVVTQHSIAINTVFVIYTVILLYLGLRAYRQTHDLADYILGGRRLGSWVTALSAGASDMSGWLLLGLPGYAYIAGMEASWIALGLLVGTYLNWRLVAPRLRTYSEIAGNSLTLPEYLEQRFGDGTHLLRVISAVFILLFFLFYTSAGLVAGGKLFTTVFGFPYHWAVTTGAVTIILYTFAGGFLAVSWTDLLQGILMAVALVLVPVIAIQNIGGWGSLQGIIYQTNPALLNLFSAADGSPLSLLAIVSLLAWGLGYFGQPHILARFKAIHNRSAIPSARRIAMTWVVISMSGALLVGFAGIGLIDEPLAGPDSEKVFMVLVTALLHPLVAGICLAAILAAIMSTADSQLLVSASVFTEDFYKTLFRRNATQSELIWVGRIAVLLIALVAWLLALDPSRKVLDLVAYAWAGFGAAFGPTVILSLFWKRMSLEGALAGVLTGGLTVVIWQPMQGGIFDVYEIVPGFLISLLSIWLVSLISAEPSAVIQQQFERVR